MNKRTEPKKKSYLSTANANFKIGFGAACKRPKENFSEYILALIKRNGTQTRGLCFLDHKARFELESTEPWMNVKVS